MRNDLFSGGKSPDVTLAYRAAVQALCLYTFGADVEDPMQAIAMVQSAEPVSEDGLRHDYDRLYNSIVDDD